MRTMNLLEPYSLGGHSPSLGQPLCLIDSWKYTYETGSIYIIKLRGVWEVGTHLFDREPTLQDRFVHTARAHIELVL